MVGEALRSPGRKFGMVGFGDPTGNARPHIGPLNFGVEVTIVDYEQVCVCGGGGGGGGACVRICVSVHLCAYRE